MHIKHLSFFFLPLALTACTDNGLLFRSNGDYADKKTNIIYMIGDPYTIQNETYVPQEDYTYIEEGNAGWYSYDEKHQITENGEMYQKDVLTAMHRTLPLPSMVKITNLKNNKTATVRINDRGPMVQDRIIDVSEITAKTLEFNKEGTTRVLVEILPTESKNLKNDLLKKEAEDAISVLNLSNQYSNSNFVVVQKDEIVQPTPPQIEEESENDIIYSYQQHKNTLHNFTIQIGAFRDEERARNVLEDLINFNPIIVQKKVNGLILNCVQITSFKNKQEALNTLDKIQQSGYSDARITTE